ncbi:MAG TPA: NAD(P)/FAD-dependent oxidoreductase [Gemmatimonadales bacterium]|jgi:geranylgeranyl reductase family protein
MTTAFDLIVVGAGPGGSNAAAVALRHGLSVAQLDRYKFPRVKPCGGGVTVKSCHALRLDPLPVLRGEFNEVELNVWRRRVNRFTHPPSPVLRMVVRSQFDSWLVSQNLRTSRFQFFDDERVLDISYDGRFRVRTAKRMLLGRHLVGADGAYSVVNRAFSIARPKGYAVAVEVMLRRDHATLPFETPPCFDLGAIDSGYGWVFPKDDHWNVGLYTLGKSRNLRQQLTAYIAAKGFRVETDPLATFEAHRFPYGGYRVSLPKAPVYIVGDAGGFGDALTGEGIYHALESGRIAGETIHDCLAGRAGHDVYYRRLRKSVLTDTFITYHASRGFYRNVDRAVTLLENPFVWRPLIKGYAGGVTWAENLKQSGWLTAAAATLTHLILASGG